MTKILNHINTYADLTAYDNDKEKDYPNVSYLVATDEVKWNKYDPDHIVAVYNVTSTSEATKLHQSADTMSYQVIDGVQQDTVQTTYTFDTLGEHIVKYKINGTTIYSRCFYECPNLTSVTIPDSVTSIGNSIFYNCTGLTSVTLPNTLTEIPDYTFSGCKGLTSITIPDSVTTIGICAFNGCTGFTSITIPDSVTSIGQSAFSYCRSLTNITIPDGVTSIGRNAFDGCKGLTSVTIGSGVTSIDDSAFENTVTPYNNFSLYIYTTTPPTLGTRVFRYTGTDFKIYVPSESLEAYKTATNWSSLADRIQAISE